MKYFFSKNNKKLFFCISLIVLTACGGGGGGGGGSSSPVTPEIPNPPQITIPDIANGNSGYNINLKVEDDSNIKTSIKLSGEKVVGIYGENINFSGELDVTNKNSNKIIENNSLDKYSFGIFSENGSVTNAGTIKLSGDKIVGILGNNSDITNNGAIKSQNSNNVIGIFLNGKNKVTRNNGEINLSANNIAVGMYLYNSIGINNKDIMVSSNETAVGIYAVGKNASGVNNGNIVVKGNGYGMISGYGGKVTNLGEITVQDKGYGMYAFTGGYALNDISGTINLSSQANGAMLADGSGSVIENRGTISIDKNNSIIKPSEELKAINGGKIINSGTINRDGDLFLSANTGVYQIGTSSNGNYGKLKSENLKVDGNIEIDSNITKSGYKNNYLLENIFQGNEISFGENTTVKSNSILYDAQIKENSSGNIDGKLIRNDKELTDFVDEKLKSTAEIFTKYYNEDLYNTLDNATKNILNGIHLENSATLRNDLEKLTPRIYENIQKEILDISFLFKENRQNSIKNIGKEKYYFSLIESNWKVDSKKNTLGYENITSGFLGTKLIDKDMYLFFGYGYSDLDYTNDDSSKIHSLQIGIDKLIKNDNFIITLGIGGNYNYHKNKRDYDKINSKFNSYGISSYAKISNTFDKIINITPFSEIGLEYYKAESFDENINDFIIEVEKQDFLSCEPKLGIEFQKEIKNINIYSQVFYSYKLGNIDKNLDYIYKNINQKNSIAREEERKTLDLKIGVNYFGEKVWLNASLGKIFERRDDKYLEFSFGYKF